MQIREEKVGEIDCDFPGGNIIVEDVSASEFKLRQDLRDTDGDWFYWAFRFRKNKPSRITFRFSGSDVFGVRGPAVSMDSGESWNWLGAPSLVGNGFTFDYPGGGVEVRFSMTMAYEIEQFVRNRAAKGMGISEVTDNTGLDIISYTCASCSFLR